MRGEHRKANRVRMEHRHPVNLMGVDGTWRRACILLDVSESGAKLEMEGSATVLQAKEFFLLLSSTGPSQPTLLGIPGVPLRSHPCDARSFR